MKQERKQNMSQALHSKSLLLRGINAQRAGDLVAAEQAYRAVLQHDPRHADAHNLIGAMALDMGKNALAQTHLKKAVKLAPRQPSFLLNLANAQLLSDQPILAKATIQKSIKLHAEDPKPWVVLGRVEVALGHYRRALNAFDSAMKRAPDNHVLAIERADVLVAMGRMEEAALVYRTAIAADVRKAVAMISLSLITKFDYDDPIPEQMVALLEREDMPPKAKRALRYAAGKALVDQGKHDAGFAQFLASKRETETSFDLDVHLTQFTKTKERFDASFFRTMQDFGHPTPRPVFIVGMPRSGTTLVEQILASYAQVAGAGELPDIRVLAMELGFGDDDPDLFARNLAALTEKQIRKLSTRYLATLDRFGKHKSHVVDKMPHNFELLGFIAILFPQAKIIHCKRDPMDTCVSCFTQHFTEGHGYNADLATLGRYYHGYSDMMVHWDRMLPGRIYHCRYEDMVNDQRASSQALLDWLGLAWDESCLAFHETERLVHTPSRWQIRQPIYKSSLRRWEKFVHHLAPLREALGPLAPRDWPR